MKYILLLILSVGNCFYSKAQSSVNSGVSGRIIDEASKKPVDYATISVWDTNSGKVVNGATSDLKGVFTVSGLPAGTYQLWIDFISYQRDTIKNVIIAGNKSTVDLGTIPLHATGNRLEGVSITAKAPIVENKIDKMVYNAANDLTSQGGTTLDILKKVPQVTVDVDGNVELQGNSSIRFLINGKPSSVFGSSITDALATIPASQIKSIEVITSPGAKYDANGTGGIINIILKDNKMQGINGNINLSGGTRLENGSANLNFRHNNIGLNAYVSGNAQLRSRTPSSQDRLSSDTLNKTTTHLLQDGSGDFQRNGYNAGIGFDWNIIPKNSLTGNIGYNHFSNQNQSTIRQEQLTQDNAGNTISDLYSNRVSTNKFHSNSIDYSLNYKHTFALEGRELNILYSASFGSNFTDFSQSQQYLGAGSPFAGSASTNPGTDREHDISIDYTHPLAKKFILELGGKMILRNLRSTADVNTLNPAADEYFADASQSYELNYSSQIYAGYLSGTFSLFRFLDVKAGARLEHTNTNIDFPNTIIPSYNTFVPAIVISHSFSQGQSIKISYTHRIERPEYRELNPFLNLSDPYNITTGNPTLRPEIGDNFELGYSRSFPKGGFLYLALMSRHNSDDIKPYTVFYPSYQIGDSAYSNVSVSSRLNIGKETSTGLMISGSIPVKEKLNFRTNIMLFNRHIVNQYVTTNGTVNGFNCRINMNASYEVSKTFIAELFGNYNSAFTNVQGKNPQFFTYTLALRKQFYSKKASIGLTATNLFSKYVKQLTTVYADNYASTSIREIPYRSIGITFTYKFGKLEFKKGKDEEGNFNGNPPADQ